MAIAGKEFIGKRISKELADSIYPKLERRDIEYISICTELHPNTIMNLLRGYSNLTEYNSKALIKGAELAFANNAENLETEKTIKLRLTKFMESWKH